MAKWPELEDDDERMVAAFMARVAALPAANVTLPDPMPLWWKGQLVRRWEAERQAQQPLDVMERVEIAAGLAAAAGLLLWVTPNVVRFVTDPLRQLLG